MPVKLIENWRGSSVLLNYSFIVKADSKDLLQSEQTVIGRLAVVVTAIHFTGGQVKCLITFMKLIKSGDANIVMTVSCDNPEFNGKLICKESAVSQEIGVVKDCTIANTTHIYNVQINVSVRMIEKSKVCEKMYLDADFTDFFLSSMNGNVGIVAVHKIVLASHSDVFKALLNGVWKETGEGQIDVTGTTRESLDHLKDYMYLDILPDDGLWPLLLLAERYMIRNLKTRCIAKLVDAVTPETLYELLDFACLNNISELTYDILHVAPSNIVDEAYKLKKGIRRIAAKNEDNGAATDTDTDEEIRAYLNIEI